MIAVAANGDATRFRLQNQDPTFALELRQIRDGERLKGGSLSL
jgi:hypothetical protein